MELNEIETYLNSSNSQDRLKAITELRQYNSEIAVPLLITKINDQEFIVRSFVAMGLGRKRTLEGFEALLELLKTDRDGNVRAEAANSLSLFGQESVDHLVLAFKGDNNWLVRRSILAAMVDMNCPKDLYDVCTYGIKDQDLTVQEYSLDCLSFLAGTQLQNAAMELLLSLVNAESWRIRLRVAKALGKFDDPQAQEALLKLRQDEDYRVVGAVLDSMI